MVTKFRTERLQIMLTRKELEEIEDFRFKHRIPSLSGAVRKLLYAGLASKGLRVPAHDAAVAVSDTSQRRDH
jgi:hypothetical protein